MLFSGELDLLLKSGGRRRRRNFPQCAGWLQESQSAISSVVLLSVAFVPSLPSCSCLWSCLSALRVVMGLNVWASPWIAAPEFCCDAMARARSVAHAHHEGNKITNLSYFPKVYLLFVCEEDKYNCFNLRSHKRNWIFCNREQLRHESFSVHLVSI